MRKAVAAIWRNALRPGTLPGYGYGQSIEERIEQMRNIDYEARRRQVIAEHNEEMKKMKAQHNQAIYSLSRA